jgi:tetratricopeptide (TPR) repeat protein
MGKFARRHKVPIAAAILVAVSLVGGLWIAIFEAREAERQRVVAQRHFDSVRSLAGKLIGLDDMIRDLPGSLKARESLVKTSLEYLDTLYLQAGGDASLQEELGIAFRKIGDIQGYAIDSNLGDPKAALVSYGKSRALLEPLIKRNPANVKLGAFMAGTYHREATTMQFHLGPKEALHAAEKAVQYSKASRKGFESESLYVKQLTESYGVLSQVLTFLNRNEEAQHASDELIAVSEEYANAHPDDVLAVRALARAYSNAANIEDPAKSPGQRVARSFLLYEKAIAMRERVVTLDPTHEQYRWDLALTQFNYGDELYNDGQYAAAYELFLKAAPALAKHDPNDARRIKIRAMNDVGLAKTLVKNRRYAEAEPVFARAEVALKKLLKDSSGDVQLEYMLAQIGVNRGQMYAELAQAPRLTDGERTTYWRKARDSLREGVAYFKSVNKTVEFVGILKEVWDAGLATLAKAEAALASASSH